MKMEGAQERPQIKGTHKLSLMNRRTGSITGVSDVISFDISEVLLETDMGMLKITGADLHVNRLSLEKGEIDLEGRIDSIQYPEVSDFKKGGETLLNRLFR
ncbi:MAG: sporulation protein YabP [Lachnospiraceae bacterium]|nr:sporulation protein YabP [Lachnospiraceae bacterium]